LYRIANFFVDFSFKAPQNSYYLFLLRDSSFVLINKDIYTPKIMYHNDIGFYNCIEDSVILYSKNNTKHIFKYPFLLIRKNNITIFHKNNKNNKDDKILVFHKKRISKKYLFLYDKIDSLISNNNYGY
jgi:hypothetical protein